MFTPDAPNLTHKKWGRLTRQVHRGLDCVGSIMPACKRRATIDDWTATQAPVTCRTCLLVATIEKRQQEED
jgi:hypothetical protein